MSAAENNPVPEHMNMIRKLALAAVMTAAATATSMALPLNWSAGGQSNNWSDTNNWALVDSPYEWVLLTRPPGLSDVINFEDQALSVGFPPGWTNTLGAVNNIVNSNSAGG